MQQTPLSKRNVGSIKHEEGLKEKHVLGSGSPRDSMIKENSVNESTIAQEMLMAERRATAISAEIKELKKILFDLCNKDELSEEDSLILKDTQATVIFKVGELNEITHMLQRTLSLCDPSVKNFDKMFQMLRLGLK